MTDDVPDYDVHPTERKAEAIARGDEPFTSERQVTVVPGAALNRLLLWALAGLTLITVTSIVCLTVFSIARAQERKSFNGVLATLSRDLTDARTQRDVIKATLDATNAGLECRASSQLDVDAAQADQLLELGLQFAAAIDRTPPGPDPAAVLAASQVLQAAIEKRRADLAVCANQTATTTLPVPNG